MPLSDLAVHIPTQEAAISRFAPALRNGTDPCVPWKRFKDSLWGNSSHSFLREELVKRGTRPVKFVPTVPSPRDVAVLPSSLPSEWDIHSSKILVRSEYNEAEKAALLANKPDIDLFMVGGQSGIGKSVFLLLLLMRRLALKLPTILQITASSVLLFHEAGVSEIMHHSDHSTFYEMRFPPKQNLSRLWALVDTNENLPQPAPIFKRASPFYVINAVSPRSGNLQWTKKIGQKTFYMEPWSICEVLQARPFLGKDPRTEYQLWYLHNQFGASTRSLALYADDSQNYEALINHELSQIESNKLPHLFRDPGSSKLSHFIAKTRPSKDSRAKCEREFASRRVFKMVWDKHISRRKDLMEEFYTLFLAGPIAATSAGWVFEERMHQQLAKGQILQLFPVICRLAKTNVIYSNYEATIAKSNPKEFRLASSDECPLVETDKLEVDQYYRPRASNFPSIDSLRLIHPHGESPILLAFRITRNKHKLGIKLCGLHRISKLLLPPNVRVYLVVVTPDTLRPMIRVPVEYFKRQDDGDLDRDEGKVTNEGGDEDMGEDEDEDMDVDVDEIIDEEEENPQGSGTNAELWSTLPIFHYPVDMCRVFK